MTVTPPSNPRSSPTGARRLEGFNANFVALYAHGLSTRDIRSELVRMYGVEVSPALVSKVTDGIMEEFTEWQDALFQADDDNSAV